MKFYKCMHCGNVAVKVHDAGVPLVCCGEKMKELIAGESDGAAEKHVPAYSENGGRISVPVALRMHHAVCDGYHVGNLYGRLEQSAANPAFLKSAI